jgi:phosphoglycerate kinase
VLTYTDLDVTGRTVFVRSDLNVPLALNDDGEQLITFDGRIVAALPTIRDLMDQGARVLVGSHLGRPKGQVDPTLSMAPVAARLGELLGSEVQCAEDVVGPSAQSVASWLADASVGMIENLRFEPAETSKDEGERRAFAQKLASMVDLYVDDAFGVMHRKHASVYELAQLRAHAAGRLVMTEVDVLQRLTSEPERPYTVVLGGSKVSDKLGVIRALLDRVDRLVVGGGMMFTFLSAQGKSVGKSLLERDRIEEVKALLTRAEQQGVEVVLPVDVVVAGAVTAEAPTRVVYAGAIPDDQVGLDIGPRSREIFAEKIGQSRTVFWNGPMGVFEIDQFAAGTRAIAQALRDVTSDGGMAVVGGGDSAAAVRDLGFADADFTHVSTGGGASLEYLEGKSLPGLEVLEQ